MSYKTSLKKIKISDLILKTIRKLKKQGMSEDLVKKLFVDTKFTRIDQWAFFPTCVIIPSIYLNNPDIKRYFKF